MKKNLTILLTVGALLITVHRMPAPIQEVTETPSATPAPKPAQSQPPEEKTQPKKAKPKSTTAAETPPKHVETETAKSSIAGTWRGHWDNSRGEQGNTFVVFNEGPGGVITGDTEALPFSGRPQLQNGHRSGNTITFMFHRGNRDYQVTDTLSADGTTISGKYKVVQDQKVIYTGTYSDFKRQ